MTSLILILTVIAVSGLIVRVGALALQKTGLSQDAASFQAQSAFMGVGFTTKESESVVGHPVRRRIIRIMMMLGFMGITTIIGGVVVTMANDPGDGQDLPLPLKFGLLIAGVLGLWAMWRLHPIERALDRVIRRALGSMTDISIIDYEEVLNLNKGYTVAVLPVDDNCWMAGRPLRDLGLASEGVLILSITRESGLVLGTPVPSTTIEVGDKLLSYGLNANLARLSSRQRGDEGDRDHVLAKRRQELRLVEEKVEDERDELEQPAAPTG
jgi:hypothetical protein